MTGAEAVVWVVAIIAGAAIVIVLLALWHEKKK